MSQWFEYHGFSEVAPGLLVGAYPQDGSDVGELAGAGVTRILNLVADTEYELEGGRQVTSDALVAAGILEERVGFIDFGSLPAEPFERAVQIVLAWLEEGQRAYVHCRAGAQRSVCVAAGVLALRDEELSLRHALETIRRQRPVAQPLAHQREDLARWWQGRATAGP